MKKVIIIHILLLFLGINLGNSQTTCDSTTYNTLEYLNSIRKSPVLWKNSNSIKVQFESDKKYFKKYRNYTNNDFDAFDTVCFNKNDDSLFKYEMNPMLCKEAEKRAKYLAKYMGDINHIFYSEELMESLYLYSGNSSSTDPNVLSNNGITALIIDGPKCLGHREHLLSKDNTYKNIGIGYYKIDKGDGKILFIMVVLTSTDAGLGIKGNFNNKLKNGTYLRGNLVQ